MIPRRFRMALPLPTAKKHGPLPRAVLGVLSLLVLATTAWAQLLVPPHQLAAEGKFEAAGARALELTEGNTVDPRADERELALLHSELRAMAAYFDHVVGLDEETRARLEAAHAAGREAIADYHGRRYEQSVDTMVASIAERRAVAGDRDPALFQDWLLIVKCGIYGNRLETSLESAIEARDYAERVWGTPHPRLAQAIGWIGFTEYHLGRSERALELLVDADEMYTELEWQGFERTDNLKHLGLALRDSGDLEAAREVVGRNAAFTAERHGPYSREHLGVLLGASTLLLMQDDLLGAEAVIQKVLATPLLGLAKTDPIRVSTRMNLGSLYALRGDCDRAEVVFRELLEDDSLRELERPHAMLRRSLMLSQLWRAKEAADLAEEALAQLRAMRPEGHDDLYYARSVYSQALEASGASEAAMVVYEELEEFHGDTGDRLARTARTQFSIGLNHAREGRLDEAQRALEAALAARRELYGDVHSEVASALFELAEIETLRGRHERAVALAEESAEIFDVVRLRAGHGIDRSQFFGLSPYRALAWNQLALGQEAEAWQMAERENGRALFDLLRDSGGVLDDAERAECLRDVVARELELEALRDERRESDDPGLEPRLAEARRELAAANRRLSEWQSEAARREPVEQGQSFELERVQAQLESDEAIVGWLPGGWISSDAIWAWVLRAEGPVRWFALPTPEEQGATWSALAELRSQLTDPGVFAFPVDPSVIDPLGELVWEQLFAPLEPALEDVEHLVVVPFTELASIPIETLIDARFRWAGERFTVSYAPSATVFAWLREREAVAEPRPRSVLVVADPPFRREHLLAMRREEDGAQDRPLRSERGAELPRLPRSRDEARAVAASHEDASVLVGPTASEQELLRLARSGELATYGTLHFATHARIDAVFPERSEIVLSQVDLPDVVSAALDGERIVDGRLDVREILADWSLDADLVTLSACETGLGKRVHGEGLVGFVHAFLQRGARSVLVSLWPVDDAATALFMEEFYADLATRQGPRARAESLRHAKRWLREWSDDGGETPYAHPAYWAAFVLAGVP